MRSVHYSSKIQLYQVNPNFHEFKKLVLSPIKFRLFLLSKLPAAFFTGMRIEHFDETKAVVSLKFKWFNKNPFGSVYFAILTMAAEMSTGVLSMANIYKRNPAVSMLVTKTEANFFKKATGKILFTCIDGNAIAELIQQAVNTGEGMSITCNSVGTNAAGEIVAHINCTWSFKAKSTK